MFVWKKTRKMELFLYLYVIYIFESTQAKFSCDRTVIPITKYNPYSMPANPPPCKSRTILKKWVHCETTTLEPFSLTFIKGRDEEQNTRLGCNIQSKVPGLVGVVTITSPRRGSNFLICPLKESVINLITSATLRLKFDIWSNISLYCHKIEDDPNVFYIPSKEVDSSEKGIGPVKHCDCGKSNKIISTRIINGKNVANIKEYPWMVSVLEGFLPVCGGSIITRRHVITAAHCVEPCDIVNCAEYYLVVYATTNLDCGDVDVFLCRTQGTQIPVKDLTRHEKYNSKTKQNDIAILELAAEIREDKYMPICIPHKFLPTENDQLTTLGWGDMGIPDTWRDQNQLKKAHGRILDPLVCEKLFPRIILKEAQFCTFSKHWTAANGDSGGPWMYVDPKTNRYNLVGITSYSTGLKDLMPGIRTAVHHYYDWIRKYIDSKTSGDDDKCNISL